VHSRTTDVPMISTRPAKPLDPLDNDTCQLRDQLPLPLKIAPRT